MDLGDAGLCDLHHLGDFLHAEVLLVIQGHDQLLILPQGGNAVGQGVQKLLAQQGILRTAARCAVGHIQAPLILVVKQGIQGQHVAQCGVGKVLLVLLRAHAQALGDLLVCGVPAQLREQLHAGLIDLPGFPAHTAGDPILTAGQIDHRPPDAFGDKGLKFDPLVRIKLVN